MNAAVHLIHAILWPELVWLVELKTERSSHRREQIPGYFELCSPSSDMPSVDHVPHHSTRYLYAPGTPGVGAVCASELARRLSPLSKQIWHVDDLNDDAEVAVVSGLLDAIARPISRQPNGAPTSRPRSIQPEPPSTPLEAGLGLASETARDGQAARRRVVSTKPRGAIGPPPRNP